MSAITKIRRDVVDDKHNIRNPLNSADDMRIWANTLKKTRIRELFAPQSGLNGHTTEAGLKGHLHALACELMRVTPEKLNGSDADLIQAAYAANRELRAALYKVIHSAKDAKFLLTGKHQIYIPLLNDSIKV